MAAGNVEALWARTRLLARPGPQRIRGHRRAAGPEHPARRAGRRRAAAARARTGRDVRRQPGDPARGDQGAARRRPGRVATRARRWDVRRLAEGSNARATADQIDSVASSIHWTTRSTCAGSSSPAPPRWPRRRTLTAADRASLHRYLAEATDCDPQHSATGRLAAAHGDRGPRRERVGRRPSSPTCRCGWTSCCGAIPVIPANIAHSDRPACARSSMRSSPARPTVPGSRWRSTSTARPRCCAASSADLAGLRCTPKKVWSADLHLRGARYAQITVDARRAARRGRATARSTPSSLAITDMQGRLQGKRLDADVLPRRRPRARHRGLQLPARGRRRDEHRRRLRASRPGIAATATS